VDTYAHTLITLSLRSWPDGYDPQFARTLALKLDNTYPQEWIGAIYETLAGATKNMASLKFLKQEEETFLGKLLRLHFRAIVKNFNRKSQDQLITVEDLAGLDDECYKRIASDVVELYTRSAAAHMTPWNKKKSITMTAMEGYAYGTETGQIRFLSDHGHIIPLYSFGVGTFDFDLDKIMGLVKLSQAKAVLQVKNYFGLAEVIGDFPRGNYAESA
jgi:hypothetical protein